MHKQHFGRDDVACQGDINMIPELTILIVAHNEQEMLPDCLASVQFAGKVIIVLDRCDDQSEQIARDYGAEILTGSWPDEGDRRNYGIEACPEGWILEVDADERVSEALAAEIKETLPMAEKGVYRIAFDNYIGTKRVRHGWGGYIGVRHAPRLFYKGYKVWESGYIHPKLTLQSKQGDLTQPMIHLVDRDISDLLQRLDRYTDNNARDMLRQNKKGRLSAHVKRLFSRFFKLYVLRKGYKEGGYGLLIALCAGLYPLLSYLKADLEAEKYQEK